MRNSNKKLTNKQILLLIHLQFPILDSNFHLVKVQNLLDNHGEFIDVRSKVAKNPLQKRTTQLVHLNFKLPLQLVFLPSYLLYHLSSEIDVVRKNVRHQNGHHVLLVNDLVSTPSHVRYQTHNTFGEANIILRKLTLNSHSCFVKTGRRKSYTDLTEVGRSERSHKRANSLQNQLREDSFDDFLPVVQGVYQICR